MSYYSTVYGQRSKLDFTYLQMRYVWLWDIAKKSRRRSCLRQPSPAYAGLEREFLLAEDTRVALGRRDSDLRADHTHAEAMVAPAMGFLYLLGVTNYDEDMQPAGRSRAAPLV